MELQDILHEATRFFAESPANHPVELGDMSVFAAPLAAIASADDPLFDGLKAPDAVGPHHLSPCEWFPKANSVLSLFLPFPRGSAVRIESRATHPFHGSIAAPVQDSRFRVIDRRSNWSERHVAHIAGLGTFSLSRSLITSAGAAGRIGSLVLEAALPRTARPARGKCQAALPCEAGIPTHAAEPEAACPGES